MHLDADTVAVLAVAAAVLGVLGLVVAVFAAARARRLRAELAALRSDSRVATAVDPKAVRHVAVVRYDAFADMGGHLSYSVALLDSHGDGIVLSAINGRADTRAYAKGVRGGAGQQALSPEEQHAVDSALGRASSRTRR
jgi:hypothetical protein